MKAELKSIFKNKNFGVLFIGATLSELGTKIGYIALMVKVYQLTGNPMNLGIVAGLGLLPGLIMSLIAGVAIDRYNKKKIMIFCDIARSLVCIGILIAPSISYIYFLVVVSAIFDQLFLPARASMEPHILEKNELIHANSLKQSTSSFLLIVGPLLGGALISAFNLNIAFIIDAISYLLSAFFISLMSYKYLQSEKTEKRAFSKHTQHFLKDIGEGLHYVMNNSLIKAILFFHLTITVIYSMQAPLIFAFVNEVFSAKANYAGYLFSVAGIGSFIGSLITMKIGQKTKNFNSLMLVLFFDGIMFMLFALCTKFSYSLAIFSLAGIIGTVFSIVIFSVVQEYVPAIFCGRVFSVISFISGPIGLLSIIIGAYISKIYSVKTLFIASGIMESLIALSCFILFLPRKWNKLLKQEMV